VVASSISSAVATAVRRAPARVATRAVKSRRSGRRCARPPGIRPACRARRCGRDGYRPWSGRSPSFTRSGRPSSIVRRGALRQHVDRVARQVRHLPNARLRARSTGSDTPPGVFCVSARWPSLTPSVDSSDGGEVPPAPPGTTLAPPHPAHRNGPSRASKSCGFLFVLLEGSGSSPSSRMIFG